VFAYWRVWGIYFYFRNANEARRGDRKMNTVMPRIELYSCVLRNWFFGRRSSIALPAEVVGFSGFTAKTAGFRGHFMPRLLIFQGLGKKRGIFLRGEFHGRDPARGNQPPRHEDTKERGGEFNRRCRMWNCLRKGAPRRVARVDRKAVALRGHMFAYWRVWRILSVLDVVEENGGHNVLWK